MLPFAIVKDFDIFETGRLHFGVCGVTHAMKPLVFETVKPAFSGGVEQLPLRLIEQVMPYP
jgi:hypothetical protein